MIGTAVQIHNIGEAFTPPVGCHCQVEEAERTYDEPRATLCLEVLSVAGVYSGNSESHKTKTNAPTRDGNFKGEPTGPNSVVREAISNSDALMLNLCFSTANNRRHIADVFDSHFSFTYYDSKFPEVETKDLLYSLARRCYNV